VTLRFDTETHLAKPSPNATAHAAAFGLRIAPVTTRR